MHPMHPNFNAFSKVGQFLVLNGLLSNSKSYDDKKKIGFAIDLGAQGAWGAAYFYQAVVHCVDTAVIAC